MADTRSLATRATLVTAALALTAVACADDDGDAPAETTAPDQEAAAETRTPPMPEVEGPITGPGDPYLDPLELGLEEQDAMEAHSYEHEEYLLSGTAADEDYVVRVQVSQPGPDAEVSPSGHTIVEAIHPQGIPFIWNFTRDYLMAGGHSAVNISVFPNTIDTLAETNEDRYADLVVADEDGDIWFPHSSEIYAQVGAWLKSDGSPLEDPQWLHMTGHSMSVGPVWQYMDSTHGELRLDDGDPIYDGFFPETTRTASRMGPFPEVDVPTVLINSELEVEAVLIEDGVDYRRPDSDEPGQQFRLYEVAGMPHNLSWEHPLLADGLGLAELGEERCEYPLNSFPYNPTIAMALDHLLAWVGEDISPPRAEPIELTGEPGEPGAEIVRDEHGNAAGGVRSTTLDVPVATYLGSNSAVDPDLDVTPGSCEVYGGQIDFDTDELVDLYGDHQTYTEQVDERLGQLIDEGWFLEQFADDITDRAAAFDGFDN